MSYTDLRAKARIYTQSQEVYALRDHEALALSIQETLKLYTPYAGKEIPTLYSAIVKAVCLVRFETILEKEAYVDAAENALICLEISPNPHEKIAPRNTLSWLKSALSCFDHWVLYLKYQLNLPISEDSTWVKETSIYQSLSNAKGVDESIKDIGDSLKYAYQIRSDLEHNLKKDKKTGRITTKNHSSRHKIKMFNNALKHLKIALEHLHQVYVNNTDSLTTDAPIQDL